MKDRHALAESDARLVFLTDDVRIVAYDCTNAAKKITKSHGLGRIEAKLLSQGLLSALMLSETVKDDEDSVAVRIEGSGAIGGIYAECTGSHRIRGFVKNHPLDFGNQVIRSIADVIGAGFMTVVRRSGPDGELRSSSVMLETGLIPNDTAVFFRESEQRDTLTLMSVEFDGDTMVSSRGLFVEAMPAASGDRLDEIQRISLKLAEKPLGANLKGEVMSAFRKFGPEFLETGKIEFHCPCERERFVKIINALPKEERAKMLEGEFPLELTCQYCGRKHYVGKSEISSD